MIENDAFKLLLINLFHLNPDDIANIFCTTFNKMIGTTSRKRTHKIDKF